MVFQINNFIIFLKNYISGRNFTRGIGRYPIAIAAHNDNFKGNFQNSRNARALTSPRYQILLWKSFRSYSFSEDNEIIYLKNYRLDIPV